MMQFRLYQARPRRARDIVKERLAGLELRQRERDRRRAMRRRGKVPHPASLQTELFA